MSKHKTPITELPSAGDGFDEDDQMTWDFTLPESLDAERIEINTARLRRLMSAAAFRRVHVGEYTGETTTFTPNVNTMNAGGEATASLSGQLNEADTQQSRSFDDFHGKLGQFVMKYHGKTSPVIRMNKSELVSKVVDERRNHDVTREAAWAQQLDLALRDGLVDVARSHLVGRESSLFSRYYMRGYYTYLAATTGIDAIQGDSPTSLYAYVAMTGCLVTLQEWLTSQVATENLVSARRWSTTPFNSEQWDRYGATLALAKTMPLIRARQ